jgi:solute carrier family 25 (mitochondrial dicarboxylate transporter), member 10
MAACFTHPLDLLKVRLQTSRQRASVIQTFVGVIRQEGILGLYNGISASLLRQLTYSTVRFGGYDFLKRRMSVDGQRIFYRVMCAYRIV